MIQVRPQTAAIASRALARGARNPFARQGARPQMSFDWRRMLSLHRRLLAGDLGVLREVSEAESDTAPALAVMLVGLLAAGLGAWSWMVLESGQIGGPALRVLLLGSLASVGAWMLWSAITWHALRSIFQIDVNPRRLARSMALAGGFTVWQLFLFVGPASFAVGLVVTIGGLMLTILALRAAAPDADDRAAIISVGIGFGVYALLLSLLADLAGVGAGLFVHAIG